MKGLKVICCTVSFCILSLSLSLPLRAGSHFTVRRTFGILFWGGSLVMAKRAIDFRKDANDIYEQYLLAGTSREAEALFSRTSDRDTKSQMSAGLSVVLLLSGLRLLLSSGVDDNIPKMERGLVIQKDLKVDLEGDVQTRRVGVALRREF